MIPLQPFTIAGYKFGLQTDRKPFLLPEQAFPVLKNAFCWRERIKKRECIELVGRLRRIFTNVFLLNTIVNNLTYGLNLVVAIPIPETNFSLEPGSVVVTVGAPDTATFTDNGDGTFIVTGKGDASGSFINYNTGIVVITLTAPVVGGGAISISFNYFPGLPVMGIESRELSNINNEQTIFFDTTYAYTFSGTNFSQIGSYTWDGTDADFFWSTNYQGADSSIRTFFVTNFVDSAGSPIRYTQDGTIFTDFSPQLDNAAPPNFLLQARCLIPYYGRLLAFNTIEGQDYALPGNKNFFSRVRFSQVGNPLAVDAWRTDIFGKGGFVDAPTSEQIISVVFFKNTLIVYFERSTWQLRYVGEYGVPFLFERISSDFGSESTFSPTLFDQGVLAVGDRAITAATATNVNRIDEVNPDLVFDIKNVDGGPQRVQGYRDFQKELVYWNFNDSDIAALGQYFPNQVIVYNYRNQTYALFRDNITKFGVLQPSTSVNWDSTDVFWNDEVVTWDTVANFALFPRTVIGNQSGFIHYYGYKTPDDEQNFIQDIDLTVTPITIKVPNHNLVDEEIVYINGLSFISTNPVVSLSTDLNDKIYQVKYIDNNTLSLYRWDFNSQTYINNFSFTPVSTATYVGGGVLALFPNLDVETKDFNPYTTKGQQLKVSYIDFLMDVMDEAAETAMSVNLFANTYLSFSGNINIGNKESETYLPRPYYGNAINGGDIAWHRFYYTLTGQFIRIQMTYDDDLMNTLSTHQQGWTLNAITVYTRPGGKNIF